MPKQSERNEIMKKLAEEGVHHSIIARAFGNISRERVRQIVGNRGPRPERSTDEEVALVADLVSKGYKNSNIATMLHVSDKKVHLLRSLIPNQDRVASRKSRHEENVTRRLQEYLKLTKRERLVYMEIAQYDRALLQAMFTNPLKYWADLLGVKAYRYGKEIK